MIREKGNIINEAICRRLAATEGQHIFPSCDELVAIQLPIRVSRPDRVVNLTVPQNLDKSVLLSLRTAVLACMEELESAGSALDGIERLRDGEGSRQRVCAVSGSQQRDACTDVSVSGVVEDGGVKVSTGRGGTDPVSVGSAVTKLATT